jgi:hypothetical protein
LMKVSSTDGLPVNQSARRRQRKRASERQVAGGAPDHVPVRSAGNDVELLMLHDVEQLGADLASLAEGFRVEEVLGRPVVAVAEKEKRDSVSVDVRRG